MSHDSVGESNELTQIPKESIALVVPKQHVKTVKSALERAGKLDRNVKITPEIVALDDSVSHSLNGDLSSAHLDLVLQSTGLAEPGAHRPSYMRIPTTIAHPWNGSSREEGAETEETELLKLKILENLCIPELANDTRLAHYTPSNTGPANLEKNPLRRALKEALDNLPVAILGNLNLTSSTLVESFPEGYSIYKPMLLLPHNAFTSPSWQTLLASHPVQSATLSTIWTHISAALNTSHIAINSPIPLQSSSSDSNILRSPVNLTPIYNSFGPPITTHRLSNPTPTDFDQALWVTTTQNNIRQTWAPQYTMFSRGNMREKTRLLNSPSVTTLPPHSAALDMYAGIGYFAFSYRRAGLRPVICFELNPWSVEGLRRGAAMNGWSVTIFTDENIMGEEIDTEADFVVFQMSNIHAIKLLPLLRKLEYKIRHVNLGLLPSSRDSWQNAATLLDGENGGWVHVHENLNINAIEARKSEIESEFKTYMVGVVKRVSVEWVEKVKMYAPGVVHCVFDVYIGPV
ncbi:S-adenosyl-L-methionine-dependent methyltransferase [Paraphoma chrysanthemicola]|uniref:tRNA(Phe) (4-demethylwyosine(37)-C(7)) aminocarboxypropyltransferase n=1 Tax=Paraphoma chrysanthemicola TaxID=798071 RepID=A0A8K0R7Y2_9PLEO|nr:S-adenosyl-L-methionine-dependent methyltransferase [Paraphoma chrysanthemicola]